MRVHWHGYFVTLGYYGDRYAVTFVPFMSRSKKDNMHIASRIGKEAPVTMRKCRLDPGSNSSDWTRKLNL